MTTNQNQQVKPYIVIWHFMANHGWNEIKATSASEAISKHHYFNPNNKDISFFAFENNKDTSAVQFSSKEVGA